MSPETPFLDPEVKELVREVLSDPKAKLLTARSAADLPARAAFLEPVRPSDMGLTTAERHLLRAYREEVAWILRNAATRALLEGPGLRPLTYVSEERCARPAPSDEVESRARSTQESRLRGSIDAEDASALEEVRQACGPGSAAELAAIALRLVPCDSARVCLAYASIMLSRFAVADGILQRVIKGTVSDLSRSVGHENLGLSLFRQHRWEESREALSSACGIGPLRPGPLIGLLATESRRGDLAAVRRVGARIDGTFGAEHSAIGEWARTAQWQFTGREMKATLIRFRANAGKMCQRIVDEALA